MTKPLTSRGLYDSYNSKLELNWVAGESGADRHIRASSDDTSSVTLVGYLNLIRPNRIQVLGTDELHYLISLGDNSHQDSVNSLFNNKPAMIIIADDADVPDEMLLCGDKTATPILTSKLSCNQLVDDLQYYLSDLLSKKVTRHGVFMEVMSIGVLLTGPSGVGKSELALELLSRGHRLVADDISEFTRSGPNIINGRCHKLLHDFLEVRGLGVLNIRAMFGDNAIVTTKRLRLIIHLESVSDTDIKDIDRLIGSHRVQSILNVEIPEVLIPVAPGRSLAVIVEAAIRNHVLSLNGYHAASDFIERQKHLMEENEK